MTTNQTIDGVSRELLADCVAYLQGSHRAEVNICIRLLRDLLERDADRSAIPGAHEFKDAPLPTKADYQRLGAALNGVIEPAAQPQGEPEAYQVVTNSDRRFTRCKISASDCAKHLSENGHKDVRIEPLYAEQPAPVAVAPIQEDRETLIGYGRSSGLDEASTLCTRLAYAAYYPPGTRFKAFTPKAQKALGDLLIKAANEIASLPGGPYERFKARQAKKAESAKSR